MELYKVTTEVVGEVLNTSPITSTQPLERPRGLQNELRCLVKGERGTSMGKDCEILFSQPIIMMYSSHIHMTI